MNILIDARLYGLENAGLGRYVMNLINELKEVDTKNTYTILLRKKYFDSLNLPKNWKKVLADFRHYTFKEQIRLPSIIRRQSPDLVHFPHFNIPVFYHGKYVVTIHDMLMHKQKGFDATTLNPISYIVKRMGYKYIFGKAIANAHRIIVPSYSVKDELIRNYKVRQNKVEVIYEG